MQKNNEKSARELLKKPYARILIPEEDGTYSAEILEFPGCYGEGDTPDKAIANLENAAVSWIEAAREQQQEIPNPLAHYEYSGKLNLRLPRSLHRQAARFAQQEDVSLNQYLACAISARVGAEEFCSRLLSRLAGLLKPTVPAVQISQAIVQVPAGVQISFPAFPGAGDYPEVRLAESVPVITARGSTSQKVIAHG